MHLMLSVFSEILVDCRSTLIGVLAIQKVYLGVLMAVLPNMVGPETTKADPIYVALYVVTGGFRIRYSNSCICSFVYGLY